MKIFDIQDFRLLGKKIDLFCFTWCPPPPPPPPVYLCSALQMLRSLMSRYSVKKAGQRDDGEGEVIVAFASYDNF